MPPITSQALGVSLSNGAYVLVCADALRLVLPQRDLGESIYLESDPNPTDEPGVFETTTHGGQSICVMALSENLMPLDSFPSSRFVLTRLAAPQPLLLAWSEVRVLMDATLERKPLPPILCNPAIEFEAYTQVDNDQLAFCMNATQLLRLPRIARWLSRQKTVPHLGLVPDIALDASFIAGEASSVSDLTGVPSCA